MIPLELEVLGYDNVGGLTGWIQASYAAGLIVSSPPCGYLAGVLKNRQWPLVVGLLFMAGGSVLFMESNTFGMMLAARIIQGEPLFAALSPGPRADTPHVHRLCWHR